MTEKRKYMSVEEFQSSGVLQELNRRVLHPLGLALEVKRETRSWYRRLWLHTKSLLMRTPLDNEAAKWEPWKLGGIWDYRDDPEGIIFGDEYLESEEALEKSAIFSNLVESRWEDRVSGCGFWVQPIKNEECIEVS